MELNNNNYYSQEMSLKYMSCSQWKSFHECEEKAIAEIAGEYVRPMTDALLVGSYIDSWYEGTLDDFKKLHPDIFTKKGELKAQYRQAEYIIDRTSRDKMFAKYMSGDKQAIMTGSIAGVPFKIKMDSYHDGKAIVDLKIVRDFKRVWDEERSEKVTFVEYWGYDIQGAVYQEIVRQNTGQRLPFYIAAATKESEPDIQLISIPQERLDDCLTLVKALAPRYQSLKKGALGPARCGKCEWCKRTKVLTEIVDYRDLEV